MTSDKKHLSYQLIMMEFSTISTLMSRRRLFYLIIFGSLACIPYVLWIYNAESIDNFVKVPSNVVDDRPFFHRFPEAINLECAPLFEKTWNSSTGERFPFNLDNLEFNVSCEAIKKRRYFPKKPLSEEEEAFPLAFARSVFKDYLFLEAELATIYAPQNVYCYAIDSDADEKFKGRIHALSNCFDNVVYTAKEYFELNSAGHDMDRAHLACLKLLRNKPWKYVALLQNHDAVIKTNAELVQIYQWFNGSNDVGACQMTGGLYNKTLDWSFRGLKLFRNSSKNTSQKITFTKGLNECSLNRAAVDYMFDELNLSLLVENLNTKFHAIDEVLIPSLNADDAIGLPGGFTRQCVNVKKVAVKALTRKQHWAPEVKRCPSGKSRHSICLIGVEFLPQLEKWPELFANKVYPEFDYGGYECLRERLFNRTYSPDRLPPKEFLDEKKYTEFAQKFSAPNAKVADDENLSTVGSMDIRIRAEGEPFFHRFPDASNLPCDSYFKERPWSLWGLLDKRLPVKLDALDFDMSCHSIKDRHYFLKKPLSDEEAAFPLAFARNVFKDYLFLEAELATIYAPQNVYCYAIDSDANEKFKGRIHALSNCFDNVVYTAKEYSLNSAGHDMDRAHLACLELLRDRSWKYVALLQNHDAVIKTNAELVQIYQWFNGSNDVGVGEMPLHLINTSIDWSFNALNLFRNASKNSNQSITFTKGYNHCSLSRAAVDYIFDELNLTLLVENLNTDIYGIDEILMSTLNADEAIGLPGRFTRKCIDSGNEFHILTRSEIWKSTVGCPSRRYRHSVCLFGVGFLSQIEKWPAMFVNKVYPQFDYGAYECLRERLFNRTYSPDRLPPKDFLDETKYKEFLPVRFHRERQKPGFSLKNFRC